MIFSLVYLLDAEFLTVNNVMNGKEWSTWITELECVICERTMI